ncbi:hypothetical protein [Pedobacter sp. HDW13]|uniref:glycoside hydrolase family 78 protein n=1 Tax=Pedobacter sp. HDW13 TaxID=2714940 RepID=UPI001F0D2CA5|nr:hypothetical protein [Pedobacter sp. HDW13]
MRSKFLKVSALLFSLSPIAGAFAQTTLTALKTEYLTSPIGLDNPNPRFTWQMQDNSQNAKQTAYRILVGIDSAALLNGKATQWNTGWKQSDLSLVTYSGQLLKPFTKYFWRLDVTNGNKKTVSKISGFEMGMMQMANWQGAWISDTENVKLKPAPIFATPLPQAKR